MLVGETELAGGADHALGSLAADLRLLQPRPVGQCGAGQRDRDLLAGGHVRRAADDSDRLGAAHVDPAERQPVRVRVGMLLEHEPHAQRREIRPGARDVLDLEARERESLAQLRLVGEVDE